MGRLQEVDSSRVPRFYFSLAQGDFVGMPSKKLIEALGSGMLSDEWKVWTLKSLLKFSDTIVDSVRRRAGPYDWWAAYLFPSLCHTSDGLQQDQESSKSSQA